MAPPVAGQELDTADHWKAELARTGAIGWRVSHANEMYQMCRRWVQSGMRSHYVRASHAFMGICSTYCVATMY